MAPASLVQISILHSTTHNQTGPLWCWFPRGWAFARSRPLWVSPTNSSVRLGVSPTDASTPAGVFNQRFEALFPRAGALGCTVGSASHRLATSPLCPGCLSPPILLVWMNGSSLSPWLWDFHTVRFSVSSVFLFLNCCCPSFGCARRHSMSTYASILTGSSRFFV